MAELAMQLARAAAARALAEAEADRAPDEPAEPATRSRSLATLEPSPSPRPPAIRLPGHVDPNLLFIQLCRCVRETIILESRLAAERRTITDREAARAKDRAFAAALNARFPQPAAAKPAEKPLWDKVKTDTHGPSG